MIRTLFVLCVGLWMGPHAIAQTARIASSDLGIAGNHKVGVWTGVRIQVDASRDFAGRIVVTTLDGDGIPVEYSRDEDVQVSGGQKAEFWRYVRVGRDTADVQVRLETQDGQVVDQSMISRRAMPSTVNWVLTLGAEVDISNAARYGSRDSNRRVVGIHLTDTQDLPDRWIGYEGVNTLMITASTADALDTMSDQQVQALIQWVAKGGILIVSSGEHARQVFDDGAPLAVLRPGPLDDIVDRWQTTGIGAYTKAAQRLPRLGDSSLAVFQRQDGTVVCFEGGGGLDDRPVVLRRAFGLGQVTVVGVDLSAAPLGDWSGRPKLLASLIGISRPDSERSNDASMGTTSVGFRDLAGQLRGALDQFDGIVLVHFSWVAVLIGVYVLLIGPADYFGLHYLRRFALTWLTFPLIVVVFCFMAFWLSSAVRGREPRLNQVHVVDVDIERGMVRGTSWAHVYSPQLDKWDFRLSLNRDWSGQFQPDENLLSWQGLPGSSLGGMQTNARVLVKSLPYQIRTDFDPEANNIVGMPVTVSSTRSLLGRWGGSVDADFGSAIDLRVRRNSLLKGTVVNPLDIELEQCAVLYAKWLYRIPGTLKPGQRAQLTEATAPQDFRWQMTRRRVVDGQDITTSWSADDFSDVPKIVEMMLFHEVAGGEAYTGLDHSYQGFVDLTSQINLGRAVLMGRAKQQAANVKLNGDDVGGDSDERLTIYRIIIPVKNSEDAGS